ncbi:MAG: hypothetical protein J7L61_01695 [Thermoplasmata archaeon]|nr:hypothetical protein [Thermoplasmata archaeon]
MTLALEVGEKLAEMPESSAIAIRMDINSYFDIIRMIIEKFAREKDLEVVYITSTIPSASILNALRLLEVDTSRVHFVDAISRIMSGTVERSQQVIYVESPTMLENVMLKVEYLARKAAVEGKSMVVVLDSINSLAIHNNTKILSEFLHIMVNNLRTKGAYTVIFAMEEQSNEEIFNMLGFVCDDIIFVESPPEEEEEESI